MFSVQQACIMMIKGMFFYFKTSRAVSGVELKNFSIFPDEEEVHWYLPLSLPYLRLSNQQVCIYARARAQNPYSSFISIF